MRMVRVLQHIVVSVGFQLLGASVLAFRKHRYFIVQRDISHRALYDIELETGVSISPMVMLKKDWENRPFRTPFYINVVNEGIVL